MLLTKKDKDGQVLLAEDHALMESSSDSNQEINANMVFLAQIEKVLSDSEASSSSADDKISEVSCYLSGSESESDDSDQEINANMVFMAQIEKVLSDSEASSSSADDKISETVHMIMPSKDKMYNGQKGIGFKNPSYFSKAKDLRATLYDERVINLSKLKRKRRKRTSSKQHDKQVNKDVLRANKAFVHFSDLDTLSSVRRPKPSGVMWMKNGSSNTVKADLSSVNHSNLNKNVKQYSRKNLMACNNSDIRSAFVCNNTRNALYNARMNASIDVNDLFVFEDIVLIYLWIIYSGCLKHMTGNRALLTNFVEKFIGTVCFGNNDFTVIAGYRDVVIGSMIIKKVYYVEGLGRNLFSVGQFCNKGLEVAFRKSTCFVRTEDGIDLLTGDRSSNLYTIALNAVASNSSACLLAKASSS
nr:integrase, catalytic region, zinc finger, CCHC-type, peptidase aspartic, catalytic [Tanacetum cinerariifolium]